MISGKVLDGAENGRYEGTVLQAQALTQHRKLAQASNCCHLQQLWAARFAVLQVYKTLDFGHIAGSEAMRVIQPLQKPQHAETEQTAFVALHCVHTNIYYWRGCQGTARGFICLECIELLAEEMDLAADYSSGTAVTTKQAKHQQLKQQHQQLKLQRCGIGHACIMTDIPHNQWEAYPDNHRQCICPGQPGKHGQV